VNDAVENDVGRADLPARLSKDFLPATTATLDPLAFI
jgi:hypothetical protein